jgi:DNA-binding Lrp family transcriptional regulator
MQRILSEDELSLIHALQIRPRAAWTELAPVLGVAPATLAHRWETLREQGLAWITAYPVQKFGTGAVVAMIELTCDPEGVQQLVQTLTTDPRIASIEYAARGRDLILTVQTGSLDELSDLVLGELRSHRSVRVTQTHACAALHAEGSRWRLDALNPSQANALIRLGPKVPAAATVPREVAAGLIRELARNGRATAQEIATRTGRPASSIRRQLAAVLRSDQVVLRCDVAQSATRWPVTATWWCRLPIRFHRPMAEIVRTRPELRLCLSLTGPTNFLVSMWVSSLADILRHQEWMEARMADLEVVDASVTLRSRKRMGWELDARGQATGYVTSVLAAT